MANFYWRTSSAALDSIAGIAAGDKAFVIDSDNLCSVWSYNGSSWEVCDFSSDGTTSILADTLAYIWFSS